MSAKKLAIIDYGMGNLHSVKSAVAHVAPGLEVQIVDNPEALASADHVIFPGVGAIRDCVGEIKRLGFDRGVTQALGEGKPVLGICVGMQSLMSFSEENAGVDCLDIVPGEVKFFSANPDFNRVTDESSSSAERLKVPHMGWNEVRQTQSHPLWSGIPQDSRFYFVHSYYVNPQDAQCQAGETHYGISFTAAIARDNLFAVQFHPEKSHTHGLQLLKNFVHWDGRVPQS